jgi:hypothetical protein
MTIQWQSLNVPGKIDAIASVYKPGMSGADIAAQFEGATRCAVISVYNRYPQEFVDIPLEGKSGPKPGTIRQVEQMRHSGETHVCGRPLALLERYQCRWAVNDAGPGETHLFCGLPAKASYCEHHTLRAYGRDL